MEMLVGGQNANAKRNVTARCSTCNRLDSRSNLQPVRLKVRQFLEVISQKIGFLTCLAG